MEIEPQIFDFIKIDKQNSSATFNTIAKLRHFFELLLLLGLISWSSAHAPPLFRAAAAYAVELSTYLFNHHVVFLIGNAIIFSLFLLCRRQSDSAASGDDFYDEYVKHSDAAADLPPPAEKKLIAEVESQCDENDDVLAAICSARRQIKRFERTQSEKLRREIRATLRRSETEERRKSVSCGGELELVDEAEIERLSSEEFQRKIDAFIDENWSTKKK